MALVDCRDCGHKVSDSAASCPGCGAIHRAYNELNWPAFHMAGAAFVIAVASPFMTNTMPWWGKILMIGFLAFVTSILVWGIPSLAEHRRLQREGKAAKPKKRRYIPTKHS